MQPGDRIASHDGQWIAVEEVHDTGDYETVYNVRVSDWHTYFVGKIGWGWAAWGHNVCTYPTNLRYDGTNRNALDDAFRLTVQNLFGSGSHVPAAIIGAYSVSSGQFVIVSSAQDEQDVANLHPAIVLLANRVGGLGTVIGNTTTGRCAEAQAASKLMYRGGTAIGDIRFTNAWGVRSRLGVKQNTLIETCAVCRAMFIEAFQ